MKLLELIKLSLLELWRFKKITLFLIFNFTLGLVGFFLLQIFQNSMSLQTAEKAKSILGGDISISARRAFTENERQNWEKLFTFKRSSQFHGLFSMVRFAKDSKLVSVGVFDENYPLYGQFKMSDGPLTSDKLKIWIDPEVQDYFNVKLGDSIELGEAQFEFAGVILDDPSRAFKSVGFAPRVLISSRFLKQASLIKPGSTFTEYWIYEVPGTEQNVSAVKKKIEESIKDPIVQIESAGENAQDSNRVLKYFTDYLGLVALVSLCLCFLCGSYLLRWSFQSKKKNIAILKTLGMSDTKILFLYVVQVIFVSLISCLLSLGFIQILMPGVQYLLVEKFQLPIILSIDFESLLVLSLVGILGPLVISFPQLLEVFQQQAIQLFQNTYVPAKNNIYNTIWVVFSLLVFWILSIWQSHSIKIASSFVGALVVLSVVFYFINQILPYLLEKVSSRFFWTTQYAFVALSRRRSSTSLVFITMSLATLVLSILPHIKTSILSEIKPSQDSQIPKLFLFDIQPEQVKTLQKISNDFFKIELQLSPLVRSRILKINAESYERVTQEDRFQTREAETEARFRNRGVNLSYRSFLQDSEKIDDGVFVAQHMPDEPLPQISIEKSYADRIGLKIGDSMTFDVQGIPIVGKVSSFRRVRWASFQPNFFILFPSGVLEEAPQSFLAAVTSQHLKNINTEEKALIKSFQQTVTTQLKNVSIIDVTKTLENLLKYIEQMSLGLQMMAWLAVFVGLFVFIILLNTQIQERIFELNLLKILGASSGQINKIVFVQFFTLLVTAVFVGISFSFLAAYLLMANYFNISAVYDVEFIVYLCLFLVPVVSILIYLGLKPLKNLNPMDLIRLT